MICDSCGRATGYSLWIILAPTPRRSHQIGLKFWYRIIVEDLGHSSKEERWFCLGQIDGEVMTVRFTYRNKKVRIIGAGYWRKGKKRYEKENKIFR